ncbi:ABC transporter ATP-binding protein [Derxia gummosa]|uniref:ABC transporter ATP-binding protein n=1 Tax=Derxia gummosa DSM 723 TaxID=1121388 RepID=A0A8B6XAK1_9BURK|nr:ATP-binding cassette domain-containing protein [Derxia gummosa]
MALVSVRDLEMRFGERLIQRGISFDVEPGRIFVVMGGSGCGKSTLLKHMIGLIEPAAGSIAYEGADYWRADDRKRLQMREHFGVLFQGAALWSSMTLLENVCVPLERQGRLDAPAREAKARELLGLVGLGRFADFFPADISGGMKKRAGLARAIAGEPRLIFLDEPSAGLDPISSKKLDDLILRLRDHCGAAVVMVTHELPSIFAIADDGIFLDADSKHPIARGNPRELRDGCDHPTVRAFLRREDVPDPVPEPGASDAVGADALNSRREAG